jgi:hypothetical protein
MTLTAANTHDVKAALPTLVCVPSVRGKAGSCTEKP